MLDTALLASIAQQVMSSNTVDINGKDVLQLSRHQPAALKVATPPSEPATTMCRSKELLLTFFARK